MKGRFRKRLLYLLFLLLFTFLAGEVLLRIYNPFPFRLKGNQIVLPIRERTVITNTINPKLAPRIVHTRNSLGFRGPEKPASWDSTLSLIAVGGSTTACFFLSDGTDWPALLAKGMGKRFAPFWMNNAGLDGHSTFGHQVLVNDYLVRLKPKVILFLTGINELENDQPTFHDKLHTRGAYSDLKHFLFTNSEVLNLGLNLYRGRKARRLNNTTHRPLDLRAAGTLVVPEDVRARRLAAQQPFIAAYSARIKALADTCRKHGILPVFLTQPSLFGPAPDPATGIALERVRLGAELNGGLLWEMLEQYNAALRRVAQTEGLALIDLAALLPKDSRLFYDSAHFTPEGAQAVADRLLPLLAALLEDAFPAYRSGKDSSEFP